MSSLSSRCACGLCTMEILDNIVCTTGQLKLPFLLSTFSIDLSTVETARGVTFLHVFASPAQNSAARNLRRRISQTRKLVASGGGGDVLVAAFWTAHKNRHTIDRSCMVLWRFALAWLLVMSATTAAGAIVAAGCSAPSCQWFVSNAHELSRAFRSGDRRARAAPGDWWR